MEWYCIVYALGFSSDFVYHPENFSKSSTVSFVDLTSELERANAGHSNAVDSASSDFTSRRVGQTHIPSLSDRRTSLRYQSTADVSRSPDIAGKRAYVLNPSSMNSDFAGRQASPVSPSNAHNSATSDFAGKRFNRSSFLNPSSMNSDFAGKRSNRDSFLNPSSMNSDFAGKRSNRDSFLNPSSMNSDFAGRRISPNFPFRSNANVSSIFSGNRLQPGKIHLRAL